MTLHPEDVRYWTGWAIVWTLSLTVAHLWLVNPIIKAIRERR